MYWSDILAFSSQTQYLCARMFMFSSSICQSVGSILFSCQFFFGLWLTGAPSKANLAACVYLQIQAIFPKDKIDKGNTSFMGLSPSMDMFLFTCFFMGGHLWWELNPNELAPMDCLSSLKDSMLRSIRYSTSMGKHALYTILQVDSVGATRSDSWKFRMASWVWKMVL